MQEQQRTPKAPPSEDVLAAFFQFAMDAAMRFWPGDRFDAPVLRIQVALGSPYKLRQPPGAVMRRLRGNGARVEPYSKPTFDKGDLLLGIDTDYRAEPGQTGQTGSIGQAMAWMIFSTRGGDDQEYRSAILTAVLTTAIQPADKPKSNSSSSDSVLVKAKPASTVGPFDRSSLGEGNEWDSDHYLQSVLFRDKATLLLQAERRDMLIHVHPVRDAMLIVSAREDDRGEVGLYVGRWDRQTGSLSSRLFMTGEAFGRGRFDTFRFSPSGRYLSWRGSESTYRHIIDLNKPLKDGMASLVEVNLPADSPVGRAVWLSDDEWLEVEGALASSNRDDAASRRSAGSNPSPDRGSGGSVYAWNWVVRSLRDPQATARRMTLSELPGKPGQYHLMPFGYNPRTREILAYDDEERRLVTVHRETGAVRLIDLDR